MLAYLPCALVALAAGAVLRDGRSSVARSSESGANKTLSKDDMPPVSAFGDLSCMKWTGGSCTTFACHSSRGHTVCNQGYCMCAMGGCANAEGVCVRQQGEWLGTHAIRFANPYQPERPYVEAGAGGSLEGWGSSEYAYLQSSSVPQPGWKVALTAGGHVRFESASQAGRVMTVYSNRRRRSDGRRRMLLQRGAKASRDGNPKIMEPLDSKQRGLGEKDNNSQPLRLTAITDDDDEWPVTMSFTVVHPLDATFRVRNTHKNGGGLEIWHPKSHFSLASGNPSWLIKDRAAAQGIAECKPDGTLFGGDCEGRQLVQFEPALPVRAMPFSPRDYITEYGVLNWWQFLLLMVCCCGPCILCFFGSSMLPAQGQSSYWDQRSA